MIRHCVVSTTNVRATQEPDGTWTVVGDEADQFIDSVQTIAHWARPLNSSFFITLDHSKCFQRLANNESDSTNLLIPISTVSPHYYPSAPVFPAKVNFIAGYNASEQRPPGKETATVFTNVDLLEPAVYAWSLILVLSFILFVCIRVMMYHREIGNNHSHHKKRTLLRFVRRELSQVFYQSNERFKLITLLYSLFCFYVVTSFLCLYKTSHVIMEEPFFPKSYRESLDYERSFMLFYDQFVEVSSGFERAPSHSLKGKLWKKLISSGISDLSLKPQTVASPAMPTLLTRFATAVVVDKYIGVASSITIPLLKSLACGLSPEGQLWFLKVLSDPSEPEIIYGYALSPFTRPKIIEKACRRSFENNVYSRTYELALDATEIASRIKGVSRKHQWKQWLACNDENTLKPDVVVYAVPLSYFRSFFMACVAVWTFAFVINTIQIVYCCMKKCCRRKRRVDQLGIPRRLQYQWRWRTGDH